MIKRPYDQMPEEVKNFLLQLDKNPIAVQEDLSIEERRAEYLATRPWSGAPEEVKQVKHLQIELCNRKISLRAYIPTDQPAPVMLYFHGGVYVMGDLETHDALLRKLANQSGCVILAVDYRRGPEHKFPAALEDGWEALNWCEKNGISIGADTSRIMVGGDSAGGGIAATIARLSAHRNGPEVKLQVLIYPMLDATGSTPSFQLFGEDYFLTKKVICLGYDHYLPPGVSLKHPDVSPFWAEDLSGLPPAFILTAQFDPLRDEGELYAQKLRAAGSLAFHIRYAGMIHGFFQFNEIFPQGKIAIEETAAIMKMLMKHD